MKLITRDLKFNVMIIERACKAPDKKCLKNSIEKMEVSKMKKEKISSILLSRAEGLIEECKHEYKAKTMKGANKILQKMALTAPKHGSNKVDFYIEWTDGIDYQGTYFLQHNTVATADLRKHFLGNLKSMINNDAEFNQLLARREF